MNIEKLAIFHRQILLNTWELVEEANLLFNNEYYARAYSLAHLALEENAKLTVLTFLSIDILHGKEIKSDELKKIFSSELFTNHKLKLRLVFLRLPGFNYQESISAVNELNLSKNRSLYTDFIGGEMYKPRDVINKGKAFQMIDLIQTTLQKGLEDVNIKNVQEIPSITEKMIVENYKKNFIAGGAVFLDRNTTETYIDVLKRIIKTEADFNKIKIGASA